MDNGNENPSVPSRQAMLSWVDTLRARFSDGGAALASHSEKQRQVWKPENTKETSMASIADLYAPKGLEQPFEQLYRALHPCLVENQVIKQAPPMKKEGCTKQQQNACVFLQGPRGSGKTLLLEQCLSAFRDELSTDSNNATATSISSRSSAAAMSASASTNNQQPRKTTSSMFSTRMRIVRLPGSLLVKDIQDVLRDITRQLSALGVDTHATRTTNNHLEEDVANPKKKRRLVAQDSNHIELLNEVLELASVDGIPILFVLDDLDVLVSSSFSSSNKSSSSWPVALENNQHSLLLYHLLDRVAQNTSYLGVVGLSSHQGLLEQMEKRIASRAQGTATFVQLGPLSHKFEDLADALLHLMKPVSVEKTNDSSSIQNFFKSIHTDAAVLLKRSTAREVDSTTTTATNSASNNHTAADERVHQLLQRNFRLGKTMRWFSRVFYLALSLFREDLRRASSSKSAGRGSDGKPMALPRFSARHVHEALGCMGAGGVEDGASTRTSAQNASASHDAHFDALRSLSGPQVALVLACRRVLARESHRSGTNKNRILGAAVPLTFERTLQEYRTSYKGNKYSTTTLQRAFLDLCHLALLRPAADHSGHGAWQYQHSDELVRNNSISSHTMLDWNTLDRIPLHLTVDIHRHVYKALEQNLLDCSTALCEWGKRLN